MCAGAKIIYNQNRLGVKPNPPVNCGQQHIITDRIFHASVCVDVCLGIKSHSCNLARASDLAMVNTVRSKGVYMRLYTCASLMLFLN